MNATEILVLAGVATAIVTTLLGGLIWIVKAQVATLQADMRPDGGASSRDQLTRIELDVREIRGKLDDHIEWHLER